MAIVCRDLVELVTDFLEGELSWRRRRQVERHLAACDGCSAYVEQVRLAIRAAGELPPEPVDPHVREELLRAFREHG